jgi:hypothetical protein
MLINGVFMLGLYKCLMFENVQNIYFKSFKLKCLNLLNEKGQFNCFNLRTFKENHFLAISSHGFVYTNLEIDSLLFYHVKKGHLRIKTYKLDQKWHFLQKYFNVFSAELMYLTIL